MIQAKKIVSGILLLGFCLSCSSELEVITEGDSIPVVYCMLNPEDSIHRLRLTKSFIGFDNAYDLAKNPENIYYNDASVTMKIVSNNGWPLGIKDFSKDTSLVRNAGIFPGYNELFILQASLDYLLNDEFKITLFIRIDDQSIITSEQVFFNKPEVLAPSPSYGTKLSLYSGEPLSMRWTKNQVYKTHAIEFIFNYSEFKNQSETKHSKKFTKHLTTTSLTTGINSGELSYQFDSQLLMLWISKIVDEIDVDYRSFTSLGFVLLSSTKEFDDYTRPLDISVDRTGLPISNIEGGTGLFALISRTERLNYGLDQRSIDSLAKGNFTKHLRFINY